jgi:hypothetical protein
MKVQNWDRWHQERDLVSDTVDAFSRTCSAGNAPNYAYEAGWWSSMVKRLLMEVPRARRESEIRYLEDQIRKMEAQQIVQTLMRE